LKPSRDVLLTATKPIFKIEEKFKNQSVALKGKIPSSMPVPEL
jgi:hypothetical protein